MKLRQTITFFGALAIAASCTEYTADDMKFENVVYLDVAELTDVLPATIKNTDNTAEKKFSAVLSYPEAGDVTVNIAVEPDMVSHYNAAHGTDLKVLDPKYYTISETDLVIPAGKTMSESVSILFKDLLGTGEDEAGALPLDETFLLPVTINGASISILGGSATAYYLVKRSSNITVAAQIGEGNWINFPSLDKYSDNSKVFNGLTEVTYEALIYIDKFSTSTVTAEGSDLAVNINSIMGVEQYLLLRLGDTNFERQQLQFDGSGGGSSFGKIPETDASKNLAAGRWYHVACTYSQETKKACIYVDGKLQSEADEVGIATQTDANKINLAMRALYNAWEQNPNAKPDWSDKSFADLKCEELSDAYQFFIGRSYDDYRTLNGKIAEARVWSVARTAEQIWENMYEIKEPQSDPTLLGYWKFNDGPTPDNRIKDWSKYGNDGFAQKELTWPDGIEIEKINEKEE